MPVEPSEFRRILGHWTTGVAVVTSVEPGGEPRGFTANAVASVSLEPPLVLVCVDSRADTLRCIRQSGIYAVSVLQQSDEQTARRFAGDEGDKFRGTAYRSEVTGAPVLEQALAWVDCRVHHEYDGGDHVIFVGEVVAGDAGSADPLVFYRGGYHRLVP